MSDAEHLRLLVGQLRAFFAACLSSPHLDVGREWDPECMVTCLARDRAVLATC